MEEDGIYAPLTANGNLLVNDVLVSCHSNMAAQTLQQTFFRWWRTLHWLLGKLPLPWWEEEALDEGQLPLGVRFITSVLDTLLPISMLAK